MGSGQSPSSVHPGSPPSAIDPPPSSKRPGYYYGADSLPTKRPRISRCQPPTRPDPAPTHKSSVHMKGGGDGGGGGIDNVNVSSGISFNSNSSIVGNSTNGINRYSGSGVRWNPSLSSGMSVTNTVTTSAPSSIPSHIDRHMNNSSSLPVINDSKEEKQHSSSLSSSLSIYVSSLSPSLPASSLQSSFVTARSEAGSLVPINNNSTEPNYVS